MKVDNRQIKVIDVYAPIEQLYDEEGNRLVDVHLEEGSIVTLVFDDGEQLNVTDLIMYGMLGDGRHERATAYEYNDEIYLTITAKNVKLQTMS